MPTLKTYSTTKLRFVGYPKGHFPTRNGEPISHQIKGYIFNPPDYVTDVAYEEAIALRAQFAYMYELVHEEDASIGEALSRAEDRILEMEKELKKLRGKRRGRKPKDDEPE